MYFPASVMGPLDQTSAFSSLDVEYRVMIYDFLGLTAGLTFLVLNHSLVLDWGYYISLMGPSIDFMSILDGCKVPNKQEEPTLNKSYQDWKLARSESLAREMLIPERSQLEPTIENAACHLGVSAQDLALIFQFWTPRNLGVRHLEKIMALTVSVPTSLSREEADTQLLHQHNFSIYPFPDMAPIPSTKAPSRYVAPSTFPDGSKSIQLASLITNENKRRQIKPFLRDLEKDMERGRSLSLNNKQSRSSGQRHLIIEAADCDPRFVGCSMHISEDGVCTPRDDSDVHMNRFQVARIVEALGPEYDDQALFFALDYGFPLGQTTPWGLTLCSPMQSARPYLQALTEAVDKEVKKGWVYTTANLYNKRP